MDITVLKLVSGEEIIGKVIENTEEHLLLSDIRVLVMQPTGAGQVGVAMLPWMMTAPEEDIPIRKSDIMFLLSDVPKQIEEGYIQQTSGIQFATGL